LPSWSVHLNICRHLLGENFCIEDLVKIDELIDTGLLHDIGRKDKRRDCVRLAALLVKHYFRGAITLNGLEIREVDALRKYLENVLGNIDEYLRNVSERYQKAIEKPSIQFPLEELCKIDFTLCRAIELFSVAASLYIKKFVDTGTLEEKLVLAWYLHMGTPLLVDKRALEYALLHHIVDLADEYAKREKPGKDICFRIVNRIRENKILKEIVNKLDLLVSGYDIVEHRSYYPSKLFENLLKHLERKAREVYAVIAYSMYERGTPPGHIAFADEIRELIILFRQVHGYKGYIKVNDELLHILGAVQRIVKLLREKREVKLEFYSRGVKYEDILNGCVEPELTMVVKDYHEFKNKLCSDVLSAKILTFFPEKALKIRTICSGFKD